MNLVILSGTLTNIEEYTDNIKIGRLEDEEHTYLIYWEKHNFNNCDLMFKRLTIVASISHIVIRVKKREKLCTCYRVMEMEIIEDI